jgi:hypothetical protein
LRDSSALLSLLVTAFLGVCGHASLHSSSILISVSKPLPTHTPRPTSSELENEKLIQEIRQLEISNQNQSNPWRYWVILAPTLVGIAAILTFGLGWWTQRSESKRQREKDRVERENENIREFDSRFASVVSNLGSDSVSLQVSAAAILAIFLDDRYTRFKDHIIRVACANLRVGRSTVVRDLLVDVLGVALKGRYGADSIQSPGERIDVSDADLHGFNVVNARLRDAFFAERTDLTLSNLDSCDLWKSNLRQAILAEASLRHANLGQARLDQATLVHARFGGCRATSASFRGADARFAMFQGASLQSAHFEDSDLRGARFDGANLADCYFWRAKLDAEALRSMLKGLRWRSAHFDAPVQEQLLAYMLSSTVPS